MYRFILDYEYRNISAELPLPPKAMTTKLGGKNVTLDLVNSGEISVIKDIGLRDISFQILLPKDDNVVGAMAGEFHEPIYFLSLFRNIMADKKPVRLIILRDLPNGTSIFNGDISLSLESYVVTENGGEEGDFYVDLNFKEYRSLESTEAVITEGEVKEETTREVKETAKTYVVKQGDCLWAIAKAELGSGEKYTELASLNGLNYPYTLSVGQTIKLQ
ncbi:MAG: LysM peptidoglycan-binding domain-containing protein [Eubacterium sp.]|nr:LysM peptidoglycan-binding domain-containing protein [Eubacterium sp.]